MAESSTRDLWHELRGKQCASAVKAVCDSLEKTQRRRRERIIRNTSLYENRPLASLAPDAYFTGDELVHDDFDAVRVNLARMLVNAAHAKIAGKQKPKTQFVVTNGDWASKRKAKKQERMVEAWMLQPQGPSSDAWEECLKAQLFAMVGDLGAVKTTANVAEERVDIRAVPGWQLLVDPVDAAGGQPLTLIHVYPADMIKLAAEFPKFAKEILAAPDLSGESNWAAVFGRTSDVSRVCLVREAWRLQVSKKKPGRHAIIVGEVDLADEDYTRTSFPFEFYTWEQWLQGIYGSSIIDSVYQLTMEANASMQRMSEAERYGSNQMVFYQENTVDTEKLESNVQKTMIPVKASATMMPTFNTPNAISQSSVNWWKGLISTAHDVSGVSEMSATGEKQPGVEAASAIRLVSQLGTERFSVQWQAFERRTAVGQARQIMSCLRELTEALPDFKVRLHGSEGGEEVKATDVILEEDMYVIQPYPVPGVVNTPADRVDMGSDLFAKQIIGAQSLARIYESKDTPGELAGAGTWTSLIDKYIESWLDATKESEARGAEGDPTGFRYRPPIKWMPLPDIIVQVGRAYADAEMDGAPDYNLQFFIRFMGDADREIEKAEAQKAVAMQAAQAAAAPPMAPPMPVAPETAPPGMLQ